MRETLQNKDAAKERITEENKRHSCRSKKVKKVKGRNKRCR